MRVYQRLVELLAVLHQEQTQEMDQADEDVAAKVDAAAAAAGGDGADGEEGVRYLARTCACCVEAGLFFQNCA